MELTGTYAGTVESARDPEKLARIKVRVPLVYGDGNQVPTDSLPWALPAGMPNGAGGGMSWLPDVGDHVWVRFLDGEPEKPIWEWGMQDRSQAEAEAFQSYDVQQGTGELKEDPVKSSLMRRFGHTIDIAPGSVLATTQYGYSVLLTDSEALQGSVALRTAMAQTVELSDATQTLMILASQLYEIIYSNAVFHAGNLTLNVTEGDLVANVVGMMSMLVEGPATWTIQGPALLTSNDITFDADTSIISMVPASIDVDALILNLNVGVLAADITGEMTAEIAGSVVANALANFTLNTTGIFTLAGANSVLIGAASGQPLVLSAGPRALTITDAGFNFT